jgi:D-xylose transport system substrate-binding protein
MSKNRTESLRFVALTLAVIIVFIASACVEGPSDRSNNSKSNSGRIRIGLSMDTLKEERWQRDRDLFVERAKELGADVLVQSADGDDNVQTQQAENLLTQGVNVLVVIPHNGEVAASIVDDSHRQNGPSFYDRLIRNSEPDLYISFDNERSVNCRRVTGRTRSQRQLCAHWGSAHRQQRDAFSKGSNECPKAVD